MKNFAKKAKGLLRTAEMKAAAVGAVAATVMTGVASAVGEDGADSSAVTSAFATGFEQIASDGLAMIAIIVPIALGVAGTVWLVKRAMGWFKSMTR